VYTETVTVTGSATFDGVTFKGRYGGGFFGDDMGMLADLDGDAIDDAGGGDNWLDSVQTTLDVASITLDVTGVGATISWVPDIVNGFISAGRRDWKGFGLSAFAAIPYFGIGANAAKATDRIYSTRELLRSAAEPGPYHNFPAMLDEWIYEGTRRVVNSDDVLYRPGTINGVAGVYEIGVRPSASGRVEVVTHRFFNPTGGK
jgi:hypothetical protein